jgi:hypothetical protein
MPTLLVTNASDLGHRAPDTVAYQRPSQLRRSQPMHQGVKDKLCHVWESLSASMNHRLPR